MKRNELPAPVADHVVVVLAGGIHQLVSGDAVAEVKASDETVVLEQLQDPVHTGPRDRPLRTLAVPERVLDLDRAQRTVLTGQQIDQLVGYLREIGKQK